MPKYITLRKCHNLNIALFGAGYTYGEYDVPIIKPNSMGMPDLEGLNWVGFNYARSIPKEDRPKTGIHFFVDDYQFERIWDKPQENIKVLEQFGAVCSPDFSPYSDWPKAVQLYNHWRKHWCGRWWQENGITVVPTVTWSDRTTLRWCFDGEPKGCAVAVSSVGMFKKEKYIDWLVEGYLEMERRLQPSCVLWRGMVPPQLEEYKGKFVFLDRFTDKFHEMDQQEG